MIPFPFLILPSPFLWVYCVGLNLLDPSTKRVDGLYCVNPFNKRIVFGFRVNGLAGQPEHDPPTRFATPSSATLKPVVGVGQNHPQAKRGWLDHPRPGMEVAEGENGGDSSYPLTHFFFLKKKFNFRFFNCFLIFFFFIFKV
jgi:hypothetical protein